jgi:hypothetical protein
MKQKVSLLSSFVSGLKSLPDFLWHFLPRGRLNSSKAVISRLKYLYLLTHVPLQEKFPSSVPWQSFIYFLVSKIFHFCGISLVWLDHTSNSCCGSSSASWQILSCLESTVGCRACIIVYPETSWSEGMPSPQKSKLMSLRFSHPTRENQLILVRIFSLFAVCSSVYFNFIFPAKTNVKYS